MESMMGTFMSQEKVDRFYDKVSRKIEGWDESVGRYREKYDLLARLPVSQIIHLVKMAPTVLHLLISLLNHEDISPRTKRILGGVIAYFVSPIDLIPEGIVGPIGYVDDVLVAMVFIDRLLNGDNAREQEIIAELWRGTTDELAALRALVQMGDVLRYLEKSLRKIFPGM